MLRIILLRILVTAKCLRLCDMSYFSAQESTPWARPYAQHRRVLCVSSGALRIMRSWAGKGRVHGKLLHLVEVGNAHGPQLRGSGIISRWHPCCLPAPLSHWWAPTVFERVPDLMQVIGEMCLPSSFLTQLKESFLLLCICRLPLSSRIIEL